MSKFILLGLDGACPDIIDEAIRDALMPNFQRLRQIGCWADNVPFPSAVTPGNWTSVATGSRPATHGISDFAMHAPGAPLDESYEVFTTNNNNRAQFVWDAYSERGCKVATISFPGSLPRTHSHHLAIGNEGMPGENGPPYTIARSRALVAGDLDPVGPYGWREHENVSLHAADEGPEVEGFEPRCVLDFCVQATSAGYRGEHPFRVYLGRCRGSAPMRRTRR